LGEQLFADDDLSADPFRAQRRSGETYVGWQHRAGFGEPCGGRQISIVKNANIIFEWS